MDPVTIALLAQAGLGAYQFFKGQSDQSKLQRPGYQIPEEIKQKLTDAQSRVIQGLPDAAKKLYIDNLQRSMAIGLRNLSTRQAGIAGLAGITDVGAQESRQLAAQDAAQRLQSERERQAAIGAAQSEMAGYRDKAFADQLQKYQQQAQASQALMGAGIQNIAGAVQGGIGAYGQSKYLDALKSEGAANRKALQDLLGKGSTTATDLSGSGMYGGGAGGGGGVATSQLMGLGGAPDLGAQTSAEMTPKITITPQSQIGQADFSNFAVPQGGLGNVGLQSTVTPQPTTSGIGSAVSPNLTPNIVTPTTIQYPQYLQQGMAPKTTVVPQSQLSPAPQGGIMQSQQPQELKPVPGGSMFDAFSGLGGLGAASLLNSSTEKTTPAPQNAGGYGGGTGGGVGGGAASATVLGMNPEGFSKTEIEKLNSLSNDEKANLLLKDFSSHGDFFYDKYYDLKKTDPQEAVAMLNRILENHFAGNNPNTKKDLRKRLNITQ